MFVRSDISLNLDDSHTSHIHIPAVDVVPLWLGMQQPRVNGIAIDHFQLGEPNPLLEARRSRDARDHHKLDELCGLARQLPTLSLLQAVLGGRDVLAGKGLEEDLQLVLPKLLLAGLVEEGKLAHMVHEDEAEDGQFGVVGSHFAKVGFEGGAEAAEGSRRVELINFPANLLADEFSLQV